MKSWVRVLVRLLYTFTTQLAGRTGCRGSGSLLFAEGDVDGGHGDAPTGSGAGEVRVSPGEPSGEWSFSQE